MSNIFTKFKRDILGLGWMALGVFLTLSLVSFNPKDPSLNSISTNDQIQNYCGYFGSFLSDILYQFFGMSAWLFLISLVRLSIRSFQGKEQNWSKLSFLWWVFLIFTTTSVGSLYWPQIKFYEGQISVGGALGGYLTQWMLPIFNFAGLSVILGSSLLILIVFYTQKPLKELFRWPKDFSEEVADWTKKVLPRVKKLSFLFRPFSLFIGKAKSLLRKPPKRKKANDISERKSFFPIKSFEESKPFLLNKENEESASWEPPPVSVSETERPQANKMEKRKVKLRSSVKRHIENWTLPKISLLEDPPLSRQKVEAKEIKIKARLLTEKLSQFNVGGEVVGVKPGPAVTLFEFKPNIDVKISKITELADDLCLALSSESVRIIAPIPGRDVVGIETSNYHQEKVYLKDNVADEEFWNPVISLPIPLGRQADGENKVVDLRKMPHLLVAGTTGSGKSVFIVSTLTALLFKHSPKTLKLILVDPKQVDLAIFNSIPHLLMPPIREPHKAVTALKWAIREMEKRYRSMAKFGARGLEGFNEKVSDLSEEKKQDHEEINSEFEENNKKNETYYFKPQPYIVIVVEEFGDLMAVDKGNVEQGVVRLAQMARACGIHLILAMQSPRKDVVTGLIKTNIPGRISFKVASKLDSRVILDESGGERLLARGDMLYLAPGVSKPERHHGAWLSEEEISAVVDFWAAQGEPEFDPLAMKALEGSGGGFELEGVSLVSEESDEGYDDRYDEVVAFVSSQKSVSASLLQRRFRLGYPRAARLIEIMESEGVVGPANGSKPREVLVGDLSGADR